MSVNTWGAVNTWEAGAAPPTVIPVVFSGNINNRAAAVDGSFVLNVSGGFSGTETPFTYSLLSGTLPTGVTLNTNTGVISGTPTVLGLSSGIIIRATDSASNIADTNSFSIEVVEGVVVPITERRSIQTITKYLVSQGFTGSSNDVIVSWLLSEGFPTTYNEGMNQYLGAAGYTGSFADKLAAWKKG